MEHGGDIYTNQNTELDFSVNLSPLGPPEAAVRAAQEGIRPDLIAQYPDRQCRELREALARERGLPKEWILCGNGASELLMAAAQAVRPASAMIPVPTYQGYESALEAVGAKILWHRLRREDGYMLTEEILREGFLTEGPVPESGGRTCVRSENRGASMLFLCNPNNPVGNCAEPSLLLQIAEVCRKKKIVLVVDECYLDLIPDGRKRSLESALADNSYLMILNAFTKTYAMPGIRLGYLLSANKKLLDKIRRQQPEWSVSMIAQRAGIAALGDREYLSRAVQEVRAERAYLRDRLLALGMEVFEGEAPFLLFHSGEALYEALLAQGILIRKCDSIRGLTGEGHFYRVGIKSRAENARLMDCIERVLSSRGQ